MTQSKFKIWLITARPKTLPLALASIIAGSSAAADQNNFSWPVFILSILTALLLQIISNFANDYGDYVKGSDTKERIGPLRGIQQGQMTISQLKKGLITMIIACLISGITLIIVATHSWQDFLVFSLFGLLAIIAAISYTVGKKPYGYSGLGDISVLIFFGWLAIAGNFYLQSHYISLPIILLATASGLLATAVLNINNLRDIEQDRKAGKNTLVVRLGSINAKKYHFLLIISAMILYLVYAGLSLSHFTDYLFLLSFPFLIKHAIKVLNINNPEEFSPLLAQMAGLALLTNLLFSAGLVITHCIYL